jgi:hypothetical protein
MCVERRKARSHTDLRGKRRKRESLADSEVAGVIAELAVRC